MTILVKRDPHTLREKAYITLTEEKVSKEYMIKRIAISNLDSNA